MAPLASPTFADTLISNVNGIQVGPDGKLQHFGGLVIDNDGRVEQIIQRTEELTRPKARELLQHAREVLQESLAEGGTSFDALYVSTEGVSGLFARSLHAYGREGEPCDRCGTPLRREPWMNRSSYSCPRCQPRPRQTR